MLIYWSVHGRFDGLDWKGNIHLKDTLDLKIVINEENDLKFEDQRKETWIHTQPA